MMVKQVARIVIVNGRVVAAFESDPEEGIKDISGMIGSPFRAGMEMKKAGWHIDNIHDYENGVYRLHKEVSN